jgi:hypothetical protein
MHAIGRHGGVPRRLGLLLLATAACAPPDPGANTASDRGVPARERGLAGRPSGSRRVDVPASGVELGLGWDTARGAVVANRCVDFAPVHETGQVATLRMREVSDQSEILESLGVSAAVSVNTMFASGGARASFARDATVRSNATTLMLEATVENGVLFAGPPNPAAQARQAFPEGRERGATTDGPPPGDEKRGDAIRLRPWAERLSRSKDARGFHRHCGDSFVSAIYSGAQLLSTIQFREKDATKRDQIKAAIQASYGPTEMSADASKARTEALNKTDLTIQFLQLGGGGGTIPTSREDLKKKLNGLAAEANAAPRFHAMEVTAYTSLADWPDAVVLPARAHQVDAVVADFYWFLTTLQGDVGEVLRTPGSFDFRSGLSGQALADFQDQIIDLRGSMLIAMEARAKAGLPVSPLEPARYAFFPRHELDFQDLNSRLSVTTGAAASTTEQWFGDFARQLEKSVPYQNPNVLRILLPLPCGIASSGASSIGEEKARLAHARAVVDWYARPQSMRSCELDPTDSECLTNAELAALEQHVPYKGGQGCT